MRLGISSWSVPWAIGVAGTPAPARPLGPLDLLELAAEAGAEVLQVADNLPLHPLPHSQWTALGSAAAACDVALEVGSRGLQPDHLLLYLDIAQATGARLVRTLPHDGDDRPDFDEALRRLRAIARAYEQAGVTLAIENHDFYPSQWLRDLVDAANSPAVGVCLDAVNNLGLGESFREVLANLGDRTVNFHCKDYTIRRKPTMLGFDVEGAAAGCGMLNLAAARRALRDDLSWIVESWLPWQGDGETTLQREREWLSTGLSNLRRLRADS